MSTTDPDVLIRANRAKRVAQLRASENRIYKESSPRKKEWKFNKNNTLEELCNLRDQIYNCYLAAVQHNCHHKHELHNRWKKVSQFIIHNYRINS